jgi:hypothetical protein
MKRTGAAQITSPQSNEPQDSVRIHLSGPWGGWIASTLIDEDEQLRLVVSLVATMAARHGADLQGMQAAVVALNHIFKTIKEESSACSPPGGKRYGIERPRDDA